jgi:hypothetical protein
MSSLTRMQRILALLGMVCIALAGASTGAQADEGGTQWTFAPASAPPPPPGEPAAGYPVPLGEIGDIEFWQPNRGVLITGGDPGSDPAVPAGVYAYNGVDWHQLASVCGGAKGRIVWAGPNEFWTISDKRSFQLSSADDEFTNLSLCHFLNGQVVGSYAEPSNQPSSYQEMDAGVCIASNNCWFGGALGQPPDTGAFHLHWNGQNVSVVYAPQDHAIASMALVEPGTLLESVQLAETDSFAGESEKDPSVIHQVDGPIELFEDFEMPDQSCAGSNICPSLPRYGIYSPTQPVDPLTLGPFMLSSDYSPAAPSDTPTQLWALAAPSSNSPAKLRSSEGPAHTIALRYSEHTWSQVVGNPNVAGGEEPFSSEEIPDGIAAEPGTEAAWVTIKSSDDQAHVDHLTGAGAISEQDVLGEAQKVGTLGEAGPIACPAQNECWLATNKGWLFHLSDGSKLPEDTDPYFAGVITYRPTDPGVPVLPPNEPPVDDSLANQQIAPPPTPVSPTPVPTVNLPVALDLHTSVVGRDMLEMTFKLAAEAHVQLLASRGGHVVAKTSRETLRSGKHKLELRLDPRRWPTKIELKAKPLKPLVGPAPSSSGTTVGPPVAANTVGT